MTYTYDGDNWRTKKSNGELEWHDSFCNHGLITESDLSGNPTEEYIFFNGSRIARRDASGAVYYYFGDHLNSGRVMTDSNGITQQESDYYPFGGERMITNNVDNRQKFTSKKRDTESGLDYSHHRMLNSGVGRWTSTDPEMGDLDDPQTFNRYGYVANNPVNLIDPQGSFIAIVEQPLNLPGYGGSADVNATIDPLPTFFTPFLFRSLPFIPDFFGGDEPRPRRTKPTTPKSQPKPKSKTLHCDSGYQPCVSAANDSLKSCGKRRFAYAAGPIWVGGAAIAIAAGWGAKNIDVAKETFDTFDKLGWIAGLANAGRCIQPYLDLKEDCQNKHCKSY